MKLGSNKPLLALAASITLNVVSAQKPNIVIIMADDMGFSDIGCFGSEIPTPNLDKLAENGVRYSQFYNTARCCPTRASLLTGLYQHQTGIGMMAESGRNDKGDWKAFKKVTGTDWELYDLRTDRGEQINIAEKQPALVKELNDKWYEWANSHQVLPKKQ